MREPRRLLLAPCLAAAGLSAGAAPAPVPVRAAAAIAQVGAVRPPEPLPPLDGVASAMREGDGMFYVKATINGRPLRLLVDTGASVMVLTAADAQLVGAAPDARPGRAMETVGGSAPMRWTTLDRVELAGHDARKLRAAIVRDGLGVSLLGQNMLAKLDSVTISSDRLSLR